MRVRLGSAAALHCLSRSSFRKRNREYSVTALAQAPPNLAKHLLPRKMDRMSGIGGVDRRRLMLIALIGVVTIAVLVVLAGGKAALDAVVKANWAFLGLAVLVHYSSFALRGHRWQRLLSALGYPLPYLYTTGPLLAG